MDGVGEKGYKINMDCVRIEMKEKGLNYSMAVDRGE